MKKKIFIALLLFIAAALVVTAFMVLKEKEVYESDDYTWSANVDAGGHDLLVRGAKIDAIKDNLPGLIRALNRSDKDPESFRTPKGSEPLGLPKLKLAGITGRVVNVEVVNDEFLTQRMGTTGAEAFLAVATFTLTEHEGIGGVNFIFTEGDHAAPGLYTRETFLEKDHWKIME